MRPRQILRCFDSTPTGTSRPDMSWSTCIPAYAGGVLIIDDYGHWEGARQAIEEYFELNPPRPLLQRIDYTGRLAIKTNR